MPSHVERPTPGPDGDFEGWRRLDDPETAVWVGRTSEAIGRWGAPYVSYLLLPDTDPRDPESEERFVDTYAGWYPTRRDLMRAQLESLGWTDALAAFRSEHGIQPHALNFDWEQIWEHCTDIYDVVERVGGVHAFLR